MGVVEKLNQVKVRLTKGSKIPLIIAGLLVGGALGFGLRYLFTGNLQFVASLTSIPFIIGIVVLMLAVFFRLRTT